MNEIIKVISNLIILSMALTLCGAIITSYIDNHYGYDYITMNNKKGISSKCYANDKGLFCRVKGGLVEVKQFGKR